MNFDISEIFTNQIIPSLVDGFQNTATYAVDYFVNVMPIGLQIFALVWIVGAAVRWFHVMTGEPEDPDMKVRVISDWDADVDWEVE